MHTRPELQVEGDLIQLRNAAFSGVVAAGELSTGQRYEIRLSSISAVRDGLHLTISFPDARTLTPTEEMECFGALNEFAREHPLARQYGYRYAQNFGGLAAEGAPQAEAIIPGSPRDVAGAPGLADAWLNRGRLW